jgi:hypothetical protein
MITNATLSLTTLLAPLKTSTDSSITAPLPEDDQGLKPSVPDADGALAAALPGSKTATDTTSLSGTRRAASDADGSSLRLGRAEFDARDAEARDVASARKAAIELQEEMKMSAVMTRIGGAVAESLGSLGIGAPGKTSTGPVPGAYAQQPQTGTMSVLLNTRA